MLQINQVIIKPIITEKSMQDAAKGKYTFSVAKSAEKQFIKKAIEEKFKVHIVSITTNITKGKKKRVGKERREMTLPAIKKTVVMLKKDEKIALFDTGGKNA